MKLTKISTALLALIILQFSCSDTESEQLLDLKGTVKGKISLLTELSQYETTQSGAIVSLQVEGKTIEALSNDKGEFILDKIPFGTYDLICKKNGFSTYNFRGYRIAGGEEPQFLSFNLIRPSTSKVTGLSITQVTETLINIKGYITESFANPYSYSPVVLFTGNTPDVSSTNYLKSQLIYKYPETNSLDWNATPDKKLFPSGSTLYAVAHTLPPYYYYYVFNPQTASFEYGGLSAIPSNTASIKVP